MNTGQLIILCTVIIPAGLTWLHLFLFPDGIRNSLRR